MDTTTETTFGTEILEGLNKSPKQLPSKYFYDEIGDKIFQQIMAMPEYYLTRTELEILQTYKAQIIADFKPDNGNFSLLELGAGDGYKTKVLLKELLAENIDFTYKPLDISLNALTLLKGDLENEIPSLPVEIINGDYFDSLKKLKGNHRHKLVLFLGSNIGNLSIAQATGFLQQVHENINEGDGMLIGFDLKKDPGVILPAYNDAAGITASFNKNLLHRINKELDADFDLDSFEHHPSYNPETGTAKSFLVSTKDQTVYLSKLDKKVDFFAWESIHTEISQKFDRPTIEKMAHDAGFNIKEVYKDSKAYYANYLLIK